LAMTSIRRPLAPTVPMTGACEKRRQYVSYTNWQKNDKIIERNVPHCLSRVLRNWYSKLKSRL